MTSTEKKIDHEFTDDMVCPYCGEEVGDSWEIQDNEGTYECGECEKTFSYCRNITIDYSTSELPCANGHGPHNWVSQEIEVGEKILNEHKYRCSNCETVRTFVGEKRFTFKSK